MQINSDLAQEGTNHEYFRFDPPLFPYLCHYSRIPIPEPESSNIATSAAMGCLADANNKVKRKHHLSICTMIYYPNPTKTSGEDPMMLLTQFIEYHIMQGIDHIYLYEHIWSKEQLQAGGSGKSVVYETLRRWRYIEKGAVTYIPWWASPTKRFWPHSHNYYQDAQINHCLKTFQFETDWIFAVDIDEWLLPNYQFQIPSSLITYRFQYTNTYIYIYVYIYTHHKQNKTN
ncbi:hypothetical protein RFI_06694 [Reticulomyxa filosa]|uniref:Glycosyltransferase family 92 protein n=1 Tax=Reticulomyxa filosa TaxID=46433 RepID=X6NWT4_RETFI|nr:hypothetical protein RFI_06694 [Reticulomyxa filosa]|eukprot:ETO30426.1 hypothetical protein RFI_06694 [Reticulomyxa filosa]